MFYTALRVGKFNAKALGQPYFNFILLDCRDGVCDEGRGLDGRGADRGGAKPSVGGLQERHRCQEGVLEDHLLHRTEGGEQSFGGEVENDQKLQRPGEAPS